MAVWWRKEAVKFITSGNGVVTVVPSSTPDDVPAQDAEFVRIRLCSGCNSSKNGTMPQSWLKRRYDQEKVKVIIQRIEANFAWAKLH